MGFIKKNDLKLDYEWTSQPGKDPFDKDSVDSTIFSPERGEDVLSILNNYAEKMEKKDKDKVLEAEALLREKLPKDLNTNEDVLDWLWSVVERDRLS